MEPTGFGATLFRHTRREQWGLGIVLRRLDDRVRMQFQDGRCRTFKEGYYHLIDAVDRPYDIAASIIRALESMTDEHERSSSRNADPVSPAEQVLYFREQFEGGFQDPEYVATHRGDGRKRPLKRHRDALLKRAEKLQRNEMRTMLREERFSDVHDAASRLVNTTDLVSAKERKRFAAIEPEHHQTLAVTLNALLFGTSKLSVRFDAWVRALEPMLGKAPSWGLATACLGAVHPKEHVIVREKVLNLQARFMAPGLAVAEHPMGLLYERLVGMAGNVEERLREAGLEPRDNLDLVDFMWATLRPKAEQRIEQMRYERGLDPIPNVAKSDDEAASEAA